MKKIVILFALTLCVALAGCNQPAPPQGGEPSQETPEVDVIVTPPAEEPTEPTHLALLLFSLNNTHQSYKNYFHHSRL